MKMRKIDKEGKTRIAFTVVCFSAVVLCIVAGIFYFMALLNQSQNVMTSVMAAKAEKEKVDLLPEKWIEEEGKTYYCKNGVPVTGWNTIDGNKYYFNEKGVMQVNTTVDGNQYVGKDGKVLDKSEVYAKGKEGLSDLKQMIQVQISDYSGDWSIYVKNLDANEYMMIHNVPVKAASIIKLFNMATVYHEVELGNLKKDSEVDNLVFDMITVSDNSAYNRLLSIIGDGAGMAAGLNTITAFCEDAGYTETIVGSTISADECGITPVWISTNYTTVENCGHLMEDIYRGNLVNEEASKEMLSILKQQELRAKIPDGIPEGVVVANKTGEYDDRQHDAAIVFSKGADYVIVVMTGGDPNSISHIQAVSRTVYTYFNPQAASRDYRIEIYEKK